MVQPDRPQMMTIRRMCFACWITKATNTHLMYVLFTAFPRQQWLWECTAEKRPALHDYVYQILLAKGKVFLCLINYHAMSACM